MATITVIQLLLLLSVTQYGVGQRRVSNGEELNPEQNKHLVKLDLKTYVFINSSTYRVETAICSGSIISDRWILTAAHCVQNVNKITIQHLKGDTLYKLGDGAYVFLKDSSFESNKFHLPGNHEKDIALILTQELIKFDDQIQPIKLATYSVEVGRSALIAGYGDITPGVAGVRQGMVQIIICPGEKTSVICSFGSVGGDHGDSGGPLVYKGKLTGVMSYISHVSDTKRVTGYVSVPANLDWISYIMSSVN